MSKHEPDLSPLLPDEATLKARRRALVDAVAQGGPGRRPGRAWRRRGPRLALGAVMAIAAAAVALIVSAGGNNPPPAFAVEPQEGGGVRIKVYSLEDASGLERALAQAGIRSQVNWLPAGTVCRHEPHYTPSIVHLPGGGSFSGFEGSGPGRPMTISVATTKQARESFGRYRRGEISEEELANVTLDPRAFRPDQSVVLTGSPTPPGSVPLGVPAPIGAGPEGGSVSSVAVAEGPVEPCDPVPAPAYGIGSIGSAPGGEEAPGKATIAEASDAAAGPPPAPGEFLYAKTKVVQLQGWLPKGSGTRPAGPKDRPRYFTANLAGNPDVRNALVSTLKEVWTAPDGTTHVRETLGRVNFFSSADQRLWEEAGSPPPFSFDPSEKAVRRDSSGRLMKEFASKSWRGRQVFHNVAKLSQLPTGPEDLRLAIEHRDGKRPVDPSPARSHRGAVTAERLLEILSEPITSPALRAAAIDALAEMPGIGVERGVTDAAGRRGDAIVWPRELGYGREVIFDPRTSRLLADGEVLVKARAAGVPRVPDGSVFRVTAYLQSGIVNSKDERPHR